MEAGFYSDTGRVVGSFMKLSNGEHSNVSTLMSDRLLDFVGNPANATFGASGGMEDDKPSSPDPGVKGNESLDVLHRLHPRVC